MKLIVSLGVPDRDFKNKSEGFRYRRAVIQLIDWQRKAVIQQTEYVSPKEHLGDGLSMMFKGAHVGGNRLNVVTNTEVLTYDLDDFELDGVLTHSSFNDLHAVLVSESGVYACNTGLEVVQRFDESGVLRDEWNLAERPTWQRFDRNIDYRRVATTKPHDAHINHLFELDGEMWVNLGGKRMAKSLTNPEHVIDMDGSFCEDEKVLCHDGLVSGEHIYFTSVNGSVLVVDRISKEVKKRLEFSCQLGHGRNIGWTRGIEVVGLKAYVGITKARHSKFKEYTKWMLPNRRGSMPSSILEIDLRTHKVTGAYEITGFHGCAIYSIIKVD